VDLLPTALYVLHNSALFEVFMAFILGYDKFIVSAYDPSTYM